MARQRRVFVPAVTMHVIQRGNARGSIVRETADHEIFLELLRESAARHGTTIHGYVLMTNHVHLMATPEHAESLGLTMQQLGRWYVPYFNRRYSRTGGLFQGRYRAIPVDTDVYWLTCLRYIEQNPVRAQMVPRPADYRWSSYRAHAWGEWPDWLVPHPVYLGLADTAQGRQRKYRAFCGSELRDPDLSALRYAVHHGWAFGSAAFEQEIERRVGRPVVPRQMHTKCEI